MTGNLREAKRIATMKQIQGAAVALFRKHGFANTTVEDIAREAGVGPATVYRQFETKERIILWDEYEGDFMEAIHSLIVEEGLVAALHALCVEVDEGMDEEQRGRHRARMQLAQSEPALKKESVANCIDIANLIASALSVRAKRAEPSVDDTVVGYVVAGLFQAIMMDWAKHDEPMPSVKAMMSDALAAVRAEIFGESTA